MANNNYKSIIVAFIISMISFHLVSAQNEPESNPRVIDLESIENDLKREEIQRYFGYENLIYRYLTLPYDMSVNVNQQGRFVDIGFFLFGLLPLGLLGFFYKNKKLFFAFAALLIIYLSICFSYSFVIDKDSRQIWNNQEAWQVHVDSGSNTFSTAIITSAYSLANIVASPFRMLGENISGNKDSITYPVLFALLLLFLYGFLSYKKLSKEVRIISVLLVTYGFLWLVLAGGIVWYGFLIFPLGLVLLFRLVEKVQLPINSFYKNISFATLIFWVFIVYISRMSNIYSITPGPNTHTGMSIVDNNIFRYTTGISTAIETRNAAYSNLSNALDQMNSTDDIVYQIGTSFSFEVKNNYRRVYEDNTLGVFFQIVSKYQDKEIIADLLRASNVRYLVIDLNTHTIDKTPEQSLRKKFELLLNTVISNPKMKLLATDRIVSFIDANGNRQKVANVFLINNTDSRIEEIGSYAIYEIN